VSKAVYRSSCRDKHNRPGCDSNPAPQTLQSDALTTRPLRQSHTSTTLSSTCPKCVSNLNLSTTFDHGTGHARSARFFLHCESKKQGTELWPITSPNVNRFSNFFTDGGSRKFATNSCLTNPSRLKYVATLPCEI